jgi:hypothetical protein
MGDASGRGSGSKALAAPDACSNGTLCNHSGRDRQNCARLGVAAEPILRRTAIIAFKGFPATLAMESWCAWHKG